MTRVKSKKRNSGSADWTNSPRALNRDSRSKSEKVLNRKSRLVDSERDTVSDDILLRDENTDEYTGSIASGISSAKESGFSRNNSILKFDFGLQNTFTYLYFLLL